MSAFEMMFTLLALLLSLAIAEIPGGLSRALRLIRTAKAVRIGWLTPLLGGADRGSDRAAFADRPGRHIL